MYHHHLELEDAALVLRALIVLPKQQHHWCSIAVLQLQQLLVCPAAEALNMGSNGLQSNNQQCSQSKISLPQHALPQAGQQHEENLRVTTCKTNKQ
jgi:hypothetical protein